MAYPRVFISSTCYDLGEIRDSLVDFLQNMHFDPILSERGDVFYHPDLHTHEACITEVENCHLFILIIGGRFGGEYKIDTSKSITNAEYAAARSLNRPVFIFIKRDLYDDHRLYQRNKSKKTVMKDIEFPSIEKQEYASQIFEFINEVRLSEVNNGFFPFEYARDIRELLGKQFAGMMCDFLNKRLKEKETTKINQLFDNLTLVNKKTEEILENIYKKVSKTDVTKQIQEIDKELDATKFFKEVFRDYGVKNFVKKSPETISKIDPSDLTWIDFLVATDDWYLSKKNKVDNDRIVDILFYHQGFGLEVAGDARNYTTKRDKELSKFFDSYKNLTEEQRLKVLKNASRD